MKMIWEKLDAIHRAEFLAEQFPRFITAFGPLHEAIVKVFACNLTEDASRVDIVVYGLGRLCLEDFAEILFLAEHDYGYAAIKLLRGLYERVVVNETIVENPEVEAARFFDYFPVDDRGLDLPPFLTQPVKTQNPSKGELSHGAVEKDVHQGV